MAAAKTNTKIAINCDMGESFGLYKMGDDEGLMPHITIANVACGFHASDPSVMAKTVRLAKRHNVKVGAHPSLPDLQGFGRREMMIVADLLDLPVHYFHDFRADRLNFAAFRMGPMKKRFGYPPPAVTTA